MESDRPKKLLDRVRDAIRLKHYSHCTAGYFKSDLSSLPTWSGESPRQFSDAFLEGIQWLLGMESFR